MKREGKDTKQFMSPRNSFAGGGSILGPHTLLCPGRGFKNAGPFSPRLLRAAAAAARGSGSARTELPSGIYPGIIYPGCWRDAAGAAAPAQGCPV